MHDSWRLQAAVCVLVGLACAAGCEGEQKVVRRPPGFFADVQQAPLPAAGPDFASGVPPDDPSAPAIEHDPSAGRSQPAVSGGTLLTTRDAQLVVASEPEYDRVHVIDAQTERLLFSLDLQPGDEPGRIAEDAAGHLHVVLRGAGAIASFTRSAASAVTRRQVCDLPRGIAYDAARDVLHVACAEGTLVTLPAAVSGGTVRRAQLQPDLRDVLVRGSELYVSRYRSAELLHVSAEGAILDRQLPPTTTDLEGSAVERTPNVAWRMLDVPGKGVLTLHQRSRQTELRPASATSYYDDTSAGCIGGIVSTALTMGVETGQASTATLSLPLGVDVAVDPQSELVAVVGAGVRANAHALQLFSLASISAQAPLSHCLVALSSVAPQLTGQFTAVSFVSPFVLAVQSRMPSQVTFVDLRTSGLRGSVVLHEDAVLDEGQLVFYAVTRSGLACASCHPEAGDDGHVWTLPMEGARRTQTLRGGLLGSEPFHWDGAMRDFRMLVNQVLIGRMGGPLLSDDQLSSLAHWLDGLPAYAPAQPVTPAAERGKQLFESSDLGCSDCHTAPSFSNNDTVDVGTGGAFQVPSLRGVSLRGPFMHDGCADSLLDRFTRPECGGGDEHGHTSQLSGEQVGDLIAYLSTL